MPTPLPCAAGSLGSLGSLGALGTLSALEWEALLTDPVSWQHCVARPPNYEPRLHVCLLSAPEWEGLLH